MFIPPRLRRVKKCARCELLYPHKETLCTHSKNLTDFQVEELKKRYEGEHEGNANLGKFFFYIALLVVLGMIAINSG